MWGRLGKKLTKLNETNVPMLKEGCDLIRTEMINEELRNHFSVSMIARMDEYHAKLNNHGQSCACLIKLFPPIPYPVF